MRTFLNQKIPDERHVYFLDIVQFPMHANIFLAQRTLLCYLVIGTPLVVNDTDYQNLLSA